MRLIVVRHGKAERESHSGRDEDRPLSPRGEAQAMWLATELAGMDPHPDLILSSGFTRAVNTARPLQRRLGCELHIEPALEVGQPPSRVLEMLLRVQRRHHPEAIVLVGHNPQLEELVSVLVYGVGGTRPGTGGAVVLRTGQAVVVDSSEADGAWDSIGIWDFVRTLRMVDNEPD